MQASEAFILFSPDTFDVIRGYSSSSIQGNEILKYRVSIRVFVRLRKHLSQAFDYLSQDKIDDGSFDEINLMHRSVLLTCFYFFFLITYLHAITMLRITLALFIPFHRIMALQAF